MKTLALLIIAFLLLAFALQMQVNRSDPYAVLKLNRSASQQEIEVQFKRLQQKNRKNKTQKTLIKQAYEQILSQNSKKTRQKPTQAHKMPSYPSRQQDQAYVYGYKVSFQFDDGKYFQAMYNETQFIVDRSNSTITSKKLSALLLLLSSLILKMLPCLLIICACRCRGSETLFQHAVSRLRTAQMPTPRITARM